MKKNYIFFLFFAFSLFLALPTAAQNIGAKSSMEESIEGLTIYPNPVNNQTTHINIASAINAPKFIEIYNVLGKRLFSTKLLGRELNISQLNKGIYILKITENNQSETRKLVIR
ncbi:T9SS type A sorting domain-containing protein [Tamlana sp. 2_MG-2023]|uniref:T9SS type A sorting domain-containing protein n=1 Tax=unclassified Tamlana TaxID=2614803 RepID=UPI0026E30FA6|nr:MULTISPECIES: T9SS type A sorting domain-containing protein [unclassified Tamlana]MDO6760635.1 T9SS type A sorting domain-containing protein [Tamlana sp. 2_MG-2023]MDO6790891.1 T9SS type A sorting domain-containing protein [Tamlana sp. 1_MG-2023]